MFKKRIGIWMLFIAICLAGQALLPALPSTVINFRRWQLDQKIEDIIKENEVVETESVVDMTNPPDATEVPTDSEADQEPLSVMITTIVETIISALRYFGIIVTVGGMFMVIIAFRDDESVSRAMLTIVIGVVLLGFSLLVPNIFGFNP